MFFVTTRWRAEHWPGEADRIAQAGLVFFREGELDITVHKDTLFGNEGERMAKEDGNLLAERYCNHPSVITQARERELAQHRSKARSSLS